MKENILAQYRYWRPAIGLFVLQFFVFLTFRILFSILNHSRINAEFIDFLDDIIPLSIRFDLMVCAYLNLLIWLLFSIRLLPHPRLVMPLYYVALFFLLLVDLVEFLLLCSDIPYYVFFNERINPSVILWVNNPEMMFNFVLNAPEYYPFIVLFFISVAAVFYFQMRLLKNWKSSNSPLVSFRGISSLVLASLLFVAMRGGTQMRPLEVRDAFITANNFINQFSINPVFSYFHSFFNQNTNYLSDEVFESFLQKNKIDLDRQFPLAKEIPGDSTKKWNVVLVLMESMTGNMMKQFGNQENITPFLDSLTGVSYNVKGLYSTGTHTCNGIYGSLYGFPSFMGVHPMSNIESVNQDFYGMPVVLKENNYQTIFFTTHHRNWDNMQVFLRKNGMDTIYDLFSNPNKKKVNAFGVPDEVLFQTALKKLDEHCAKGPVFATVLTISTHVPHVIADYSTFPADRRLKDPMKNIYRYADWCLEEFFREAKKKPWFDNTLFVFVADHGINLEPEMDMPLSFHRSPLIFYKKDFTPTQVKALASQTDIFPTVMGMLGAPYVNNTMGIDLRKEKRDYVLFAGNNTIGCVDTALFYVYRKFGDPTLTKISDPTQQDLSKKMPGKKSKLETYALGNLQLCSEILKYRKAGKPKKTPATN